LPTRTNLIDDWTIRSKNQRRLATYRTNHELAANPPVWSISQLLFDQ
jgi:hypothetical protein